MLTLMYANNVHFDLTFLCLSAKLVVKEVPIWPIYASTPSIISSMNTWQFQIGTHNHACVDGQSQIGTLHCAMS